MKALTILWRGPLDSCNYGCTYCPFAKRPAQREHLEADRAALARFVDWVAGQTRPLAILFTPWGEALIHAWYRAALVKLSQMPHVTQVAIQTNGSGNLAFTRQANLEKLGLWITWHPTEISAGDFLNQAQQLHSNGVRFSVGAVGVPAQISAIQGLRAALPAAVPMWVNALKPLPKYSVEQIAALTAIDPQFALTLRPYRSRGQACHTGNTVISVDGAGEIRRCHFVETRLGNLFSDDLNALLQPTPCPRLRCDCFIGFAHLESLRLDQVYGPGLLARIPLPMHAA